MPSSVPEPAYARVAGLTDCESADTHTMTDPAAAGVIVDCAAPVVFVFALVTGVAASWAPDQRSTVIE